MSDVAKKEIVEDFFDTYKPDWQPLHLNWKCLSSVDMVVTSKPAKESVNEPFGDLSFRLYNSNATVKNSFLFLEVTSDGSDYQIDGPQFALSLLEELLNLKSKKNISLAACSWLFYDMDYVVDDAHASYHFFLVHNREIVLEDISISVTPGSHIPKDLFNRNDNTAIWAGELHRDIAWSRYFYNKFYAETFVGQIQVLRPDARCINPGEDEELEQREGSRGLYTRQFSKDGSNLPDLGAVLKELRSIRVHLLVIALIGLALLLKSLL